jgi:hypothetical protein
MVDRESNSPRRPAASLERRSLPFQAGRRLIRYDIGAGNLRSYSISWEETDNELTSISVSLVTDRTGARLSKTGGMVNTDGFIAGCENTSCQVVGSWIDPSGQPASAYRRDCPGAWIVGAALRRLGHLWDQAQNDRLRDRIMSA